MIPSEYVTRAAPASGCIDLGRQRTPAYYFVETGSAAGSWASPIWCRRSWSM